MNPNQTYARARTPGASDNVALLKGTLEKSSEAEVWYLGWVS